MNLQPSKNIVGRFRTDTTDWVWTTDEVLGFVKDRWEQRQHCGHGVFKVPMDPTGFFTSFVKPSESDKFVTEHNGIKVVTNIRGRVREPAVYVEAVVTPTKNIIHNPDKDDPWSFYAKVQDWTVVMISASPTDRPIPPLPKYLLEDRNFDNKSLDERFSKLKESVEFWETYKRTIPKSDKETISENVGRKILIEDKVEFTIKDDHKVWVEQGEWGGTLKYNNDDMLVGLVVDFGKQEKVLEYKVC